STDAGDTWKVLSRGGESDFHALTASSKGVMGFDGALSATPDGTTWSLGDPTMKPFSLAAAPDGSQVLATTEQGLHSSADGGRTWTKVALAPLLLLTAWADSKTVVGVTPEGGLALSTDAGRTWLPAAGKVTKPSAVSASRDKAGLLEILVVTDSAVLQSRDDGATFTDLKS
ncbi:MAG: exo-alpha-sialidase, partial [Chloroflexota bacterium]|nr:exo-alpha-sialidase [Chloroflexota bacterium]